MRRISLLLILILFVFLNGCNSTSIVGTYEYIDGSIQYWNESNYHSLEISGTSLVLKRSNNTIFKQGNLILGMNLTRLEIVSYSSDFFIITSTQTQYYQSSLLDFPIILQHFILLIHNE